MGRLFAQSNILCADRSIHCIPDDYVFYHSLSDGLNPEYGNAPQITGTIDDSHDVDGISCRTFTPGNYMVFNNCCPQTFRGTFTTTISCWVKFDVLGSSELVGVREQIVSLFGNDRAITNYPYSYGLLNSHCMFADQSYGQTAYFTFSASKWYHVVFETIASSPGESTIPQSRCFINGIQKRRESCKLCKVVQFCKLQEFIHWFKKELHCQYRFCQNLQQDISL